MGHRTQKRHCGKLRVLCLKPASLAFSFSTLCSLAHYAAWHIMRLGTSCGLVRQLFCHNQ
ncbi:hypothetical protein BVZ13_17165 [Vibrio cholerae]|nr:hypothetical protein [Vibrio cholerae]EGR5733927.1 hypothetical protein [Vibrio cholerae]